MEIVTYQDLKTIPYLEAWDYQTEIHQNLVENKLKNRKLVLGGGIETTQYHHLLFCEHPPVFTLGRSGDEDHLFLSEEGLKAKGIEFYKINRGGDITFHGPGQLVGYPIFDMECFFPDVKKFVTYIEEAIIRTLAEYGIVAMREKGYTGVWLDATDSKPKRKICAIGVHFSRWVTMHGFALNINTEMHYFDYMLPCGIADPDLIVTSMAIELGRAVEMDEVKEKVKKHFAVLYRYEYADPRLSKGGELDHQ